MNEFKSMLELLGMLATDPRVVVLFLLLLVAAASDCRTYRIPNWLTAGGALFGLVYNALVPAFPSIGFAGALQGCAIGLVAMLPFYGLRIMGAGDVKLMSMVGAFVGAPDIVYAILWTFVIGGIAACVFSLAHGTLGRMFVNVKQIAGTAIFTSLAGIRPELRLSEGGSVGKLPYGVSIAIGTIGFVVAQQLGW